MIDLVERLRAIQDAHKWNDPEFSRRLGVTRVIWQQVKAGDRRFGAKTLRAILRAFPEVGPEVLAYLATDIDVPVTEAVA